MITSINIQGHKIVRTAALEVVPPLMMICGPNGVGKTTFLDAIGRRQGVIASAQAKIVVAPATRTWRKEPLQTRGLYGLAATSADVFNLLSQPSTYASQLGRPVYHGGQRDLWSDDESKQLVKPLLGKLKGRWKDLVATRIQAAGFRTDAREWPNPISAIADFTEALFEHLRYIDTAEVNDQTRVQFESVNRPGELIDIDELSAGEKAVFSILLPVVEEDFRRALGETPEELTILIDEIEEHLHPSLQLRVLDYMRLKSKQGYQFICTTHSTYLIKATAQEELFHLVPAGRAAGNQLRKAAAEVNSLEEVMQDNVLFASGYSRNIFCEGFDPAKRDENNICDSELYEILLGTAKYERIVAAGSKDSLTNGLVAASQSVFAPVALAGITDGDGRAAFPETAPWCHLVLPVYSLESLLLDVNAIVATLERYGVDEARANAALDDAVRRAIDERASQLVQPSGLLRLRDGVDVEAVLDAVARGALQDAYEVATKGLADARAHIADVKDAGAKRDIALKVVKGKKIYHFLYQSLRVGGFRFTPRAFAASIIQQVRKSGGPRWLAAFERVAKKGLGGALARVLLADDFKHVRESAQAKPFVDEVIALTERVEVEGRTYSVIKDGTRLSHFASKLATFEHAVKLVEPKLRWG